MLQQRGSISMDEERPLDVALSEQPDLLIAHVSGVVDLATRAEFAAVIDRLSAATQPTIILDLTNIQALEAAAAGLLRQLWVTVESRGGTVELIYNERVSPVARVLELLQVGRHDPGQRVDVFSRRRDPTRGPAGRGCRFDAAGQSADQSSAGPTRVAVDLTAADIAKQLKPVLIELLASHAGDARESDRRFHFWLTTAEVADRSRCGVTSVFRAAVHGELHGHQAMRNGRPVAGSRWTFAKPAVDAWIGGLDERAQREACGCGAFTPQRRRRWL
jgi:anti-anti-sigma factor